MKINPALFNNNNLLFSNKELLLDFCWSVISTIYILTRINNQGPFSLLLCHTHAHSCN